uniref:Secreted protein n=1 Tax=Macrostomum lignano TaxID=282301 RepID=A0A1I8F5K1_9PLAT
EKPFLCQRKRNNEAKIRSGNNFANNNYCKGGQCARTDRQIRMLQLHSHQCPTACNLQWNYFDGSWQVQAVRTVSGPDHANSNLRRSIKLRRLKRFEYCELAMLSYSTTPTETSTAAARFTPTSTLTATPKAPHRNRWTFSLSVYFWHGLSGHCASLISLFVAIRFCPCARSKIGANSSGLVDSSSEGHVRQFDDDCDPVIPQSNKDRRGADVSVSCSISSKAGPCRTNRPKLSCCWVDDASTMRTENRLKLNRQTFRHRHCRCELRMQTVEALLAQLSHLSSVAGPEVEARG